MTEEDTPGNDMRYLPEMKLGVVMDGLSCSAPIQTIRTVPALIFIGPNNHSSDVFSFFFFYLYSVCDHGNAILAGAWL
jgi:hypothetical protein